MMMIRIEILDGPEAGSCRSFQENRLLLGSDAGNHVRLGGEGVLSVHACLEVRQDQGRLTSLNGGALRINGTAVEGECLLQPGDVIGLGSQRFRYSLVPFPCPVRGRRIALLEWITLAALITGALGQAFFLFGTARTLRSGVDVALLRATPTPLPTPNTEVAVPTPTPVPASIIALPTPIPTPDSPSEIQPAPPLAEGKSASELVAEARRLGGQGEDLQAERLIRTAMKLDPDSLEAKVAWAKMLGRQASFAESISMWEKVLEQAPAGSATAREARLELGIMRRRQELVEQKVPEAPRVMPTPRPPPVRPTPRPAFEENEVREAPASVRVGRIRMERFPESPRYDAFRMVHFNLVHPPGTPAVEAGNIQVVVNFYEQVDGRIEPAQIPEPRIVLKVNQGLSGGKTIDDLSAAYDVPAGKGSPAREYFGTVIQVFLEGKEVSRGADPAFLLDLMK